MSREFTQDDLNYTIIQPGGSADGAVDAALVEAAVTVISELFRARAVAAREEARRATIEIEANRDIEKFRIAMAELERRLEGDENRERSRVDHYFATANRLIERGDHQAALAVLEMMSKEGRISLVQYLIDYHEKITLRTVMFAEKGDNS